MTQTDFFPSLILLHYPSKFLEKKVPLPDKNNAYISQYSTVGGHFKDVIVQGRIVNVHASTFHRVENVRPAERPVDER
jgi:hypothetical protein